MGGGDLNQKKSWHTSTMKNQERVWKAEKKALEERNKTRQLQREREEERAMEELAKLNEQNGGKARISRMEWMYNGGAADSVTGITQEQESYLLGRRRVDNLVLKDKGADTLGALVKRQESSVVVDENGLQAPNSELMKKAALDPMAEIERRRQRTMEEEMARQLRLEKVRSRDDKHSRRQVGSKEGGEDRGEERRHRKRSYGHDRAQSNSRERSSRHKRRRNSDEGYRSRSKSRSRSPRRDRRRHSERTRYRDESPRREVRESRRNRDEAVSNQRKTDRRDSRRGDDNDPPRRKSRSPARDNDYLSIRRNHDRRAPDERYTRPRQSHNDRRQESNNNINIDADRAAKLAAMQANADEIENERTDRLQAMEEREAQTDAQEKAERMRGGLGFSRKLHEQASQLSLSARLNKHGLERDVE